MKPTIAFVLVAFGCSSGGGGPHVLFDLHEPSTPIATPTATDDFYGCPSPTRCACATTAPSTSSLSARRRSDRPVHRGHRWQPGALPERGHLLPARRTGRSGDAAARCRRLARRRRQHLRDRSDQRRAHAAATSFTAESYDFIGPNWIAALPEPGFPFHEGDDIAVLVTDALHGPTASRRRGPPISRRARGHAFVGRRHRPRADRLRAAHRLARRQPRRGQAHRRRHLFRGGSRRRSWPTCAPPCTRRRPRRRSRTSSTTARTRSPRLARRRRHLRRHLRRPELPTGDPPYSLSGGVISNPPVVQRTETACASPSPCRRAPCPRRLAGRHLPARHRRRLQELHRRRLGRRSGQRHRRHGTVIAQDGDDRHRPGPPRHALAAGHRLRHRVLQLLQPGGRARQPEPGRARRLQRRAPHPHGRRGRPRRRRARRSSSTQPHLLQGPLPGRPDWPALPLRRARGQGRDPLRRRRRPHRLAAQQDRAGQHPAGRAGALPRPRRPVPSAAQPRAGLLRGLRSESTTVACSSASHRPASPQEHLPDARHRRPLLPIPNIETLALAMGVQPAGPMLQPIDGLAFTTTQWGTRRSPATSLVGRPPECCSNTRPRRATTATSWSSTSPTRLLNRIGFLEPAAATGTATLDLP